MRLRIPVLLAVLLAGTSLSRGYVLENLIWPSNPAIQVNLDASQGKLRSPRSLPLQDGSTSYNQIFASAAGTWDSYLANIQIQVTPGNDPNGVETIDGAGNTAGFGTASGGDALGNETLAITEIEYYPSLKYNGYSEFALPTYITFNSSGFTWDSYRGPLQSNVDLRRVALHELGHFIGLDHPDQAGQNVAAIMNSVISNTDALTTDDISGGQFLYGSTLNYYYGAVDYLPNFVSKNIDFNGDGTDDIVWHNVFSGEVVIWFMQANAVVGQSSLALRALDPYKVFSFGHFASSATPGIAWVNAQTGNTSIWNVAGGVFQSYAELAPPAGCILVATGDLDGRGVDDLIYENAATTEIYVSLNDGAGNFAPPVAVYPAGTGTAIIGVADFDGDKRPYLVLRHYPDGELDAWKLNGASIITALDLQHVDTEWQIKGFASYDGTGRDSILWQNSQTNEVLVWLMNGPAHVATFAPGAASPNSKIVGTNRLVAGLYPDIIFHNPYTLQNRDWVSYGQGIYNNGFLAPVVAGWAPEPRHH